jgi:hypothetical protein
VLLLDALGARVNEIATRLEVHHGTVRCALPMAHTFRNLNRLTYVLDMTFDVLRPRLDDIRVTLNRYWVNLAGDNGVGCESRLIEVVGRIDGGC